MSVFLGHVTKKCIHNDEINTLAHTICVLNFADEKTARNINLTFGDRNCYKDLFMK